MRLRRLQIALVSAAAVLAATGCATSSSTGADGKKYTTVCTEDRPTGSHIGRLKCYRKLDVKDRQDRDQANLEKMRHDSGRVQQAEGQRGLQPPQLVVQGRRSSTSATGDRHAGR